MNLSSQDINPTLRSCVISLNSSLSLLSSTISTLSTATADIPRLSRVLHIDHKFEILREPDITEAQKAVSKEIIPEVEHLLRKCEGQIQRLERIERNLETRSELLAGRLVGARDDNLAMTSRKVGNEITVNLYGEDNAEKFRQLRAKKERLAYTVERLALQKSQKQRQLRMSMNYRTST